MTANGQTGDLDILYDSTKGDGFLFNVIGGSSQQQLLLSASSINFGTEEVGGAAIPRAVTVTNTGVSTSPAPVVSIQGDAEFTITGNTCTGQLTSHQSCVVAIQYTAAANGTPSATLNVGSQQVALNGIGEIESAVTVSPLTLNLGVIYPGTAVQPLTLTNTTGSAIGITGVSFSLPGYSETDNCNGQVPAGGSCTFQVKTTPQQLGTSNGTLTINLANAVTQVVSITSNVTLPLTVTPSSLDFGFTTAVGSTSSPLGVGLANSTSGVNQPFSVSVVGDFLVLPNGCSTFVPPFISCGFGVEFQPKTAGYQQGSLTFNLPGIPFPLVVTLTGSTPGSGLSLPAALAFNNRALGSTIQQSVSISNPGSAALGVTSMTITGPNATDFQIVPNQCSTVAAGISCAIQISFTPGGIGQRVATLTVASNALNGSPTVALSGTGVSAFVLQPQSGSSTTATVQSGGLASYSITVQAGPGFTGVAQFNCTGAPQDSVCGIQPSTIDFSAVTSASIAVSVQTGVSTSASLVRGPGLMLAGLLCAPLAFGFGSRRKWKAATLGAVVIIALLGASCGGGGGGGTTTPPPVTPAGTYTVTATGTSGSQSQDINVTLIVQ